jgi:hypothetical protein
MNTKPSVNNLLARQCPQSVAELEETIRTSKGVSSSTSFDRLTEAIGQTDGFLVNTLPFLWQEAVRAPETLPDISLLDMPGSVTLTQRQCLCVLANAFFCTFTGRLSNNCMSGPDMPSINLDELYSGYSWG